MRPSWARLPNRTCWPSRLPGPPARGSCECAGTGAVTVFPRPLRGGSDDAGPACPGAWTPAVLLDTEAGGGGGPPFSAASKWGASCGASAVSRRPSWCPWRPSWRWIPVGAACWGRGARASRVPSATPKPSGPSWDNKEMMRGLLEAVWALRAPPLGGGCPPTWTPWATWIAPRLPGPAGAPAARALWRLRGGPGGTNAACRPSPRERASKFGPSHTSPGTYRIQAFRLRMISRNLPTLISEDPPTKEASTCMVRKDRARSLPSPEGPGAPPPPFLPFRAIP